MTQDLQKYLKYYNDLMSETTNQGEPKIEKSPAEQKLDVVMQLFSQLPDKVLVQIRNDIYGLGLKSDFSEQKEQLTDLHNAISGYVVTRRETKTS